MSSTPPGLVSSQLYFDQVADTNHVNLKVFTSKPYPIDVAESLTAGHDVVNFQLDQKTARPIATAEASYDVVNWIKEIVVIYSDYTSEAVEVKSDFFTEDWTRERVVEYLEVKTESESFEAAFDTMDWIIEKTTGYLAYAKDAEIINIDFDTLDWEKGT